MTKNFFLLLFVVPLWFGCQSNMSEQSQSNREVSAVGNPVSVMLTAYSTTLRANGADHTRFRIALVDSLSREIPHAADSIVISLNGDGKLQSASGEDLPFSTDTSGAKLVSCQLTDGVCFLQYLTGTKPGKVKVEARSGNLWPGSHEIHLIPADFVMMQPTEDQLPETTKTISKMIGADISFLPQLEDNGVTFVDGSSEKDAIQLLKDHGFNWIRLRVFVDPQNEKGYSPEQGYCGLSQTLQMAKRVKSAGMYLLLDFHYSDYWADPQQQYKPQRWANLDYNTLKDSVETYTTNVLLALKKQSALPDMVQVGNEINHGLLWPDGHIGNPDLLAGLLKAGVAGVEAVDPEIPVMMHIALGGQNDESVFWLDNMLARGVKFDIIGISYYPRWHGTPADLDFNLRDLISRYHKPVNVVEYSDFKQEVHDLVFSLPNSMGKGACIWEPLNRRSGLFDKDMHTTGLFGVYDRLNEKYLKK